MHRSICIHAASHVLSRAANSRNINTACNMQKCACLHIAFVSSVWVLCAGSHLKAHFVSNKMFTLQLIQRRCETCKGSGLVQRGRFQRKCPECGGFFPWQGWKQFLTSTAAPGNGGVLRQPRNQDGVIYRHAYSLTCTLLLCRPCI